MNRLDGQLGDGDLGVTLVNGFNNLQGIKDDLPDDLGRANLGDKTMLDMMDSLIAALSGKITPQEMLGAAQEAAAQTLVTLRERPSKIGRAGGYAEKSIGLDDPGMMAISRMIDCLDAK